MNTVHKYQLAWGDYADTMMPAGAQILHFGNQRDRPVLWALVDTDAPMTKRRFRIAGTGHPVKDEGLRHVGTAFFYSDELVFHCFEVPAE